MHVYDHTESIVESIVVLFSEWILSFSHLNRSDLKPSSFLLPLLIVKYLLNVLVYVKHLKEGKKVALPPSPFTLQFLCEDYCKGANWSQLLSFLLFGHLTTETLLRPRTNSRRSPNSSQMVTSVQYKAAWNMNQCPKGERHHILLQFSMPPGSTMKL